MESFASVCKIDTQVYLYTGAIDKVLNKLLVRENTSLVFEGTALGADTQIEYNFFDDIPRK